MLFAPHFGNIHSMVNGAVYLHYIMQTGTEIGIKSIVAAVLASYRGYDTFGETIVIFTGAICVWNLLKESLNVK
jgi:multicomponent Na+:H+ antiporter subunit B